MINFTNKSRAAAAILLIGLVAARAGSEYLVKQKAKEVRDQNNERQGVTPSSPGATPSKPAMPAQPAQVMPAVARPSGPALSPQAGLLAESLAALSRTEDVSDDQKQQLQTSLAKLARGSVKPSTSKVERLARDLSAALAGVEINSTQRTKLAAQLERALNDSLNSKEMESLAAEVLDTLRNAGAGKIDATVVSNDIKSIVAERQKGAKN